MFFTAEAGSPVSVACFKDGGGIAGFYVIIQLEGTGALSLCDVTIEGKRHEHGM